jgi:hypothetical protein
MKTINGLSSERAWVARKKGFFVRNYSRKQVIIDPENFDPSISCSTAKKVFWKNFAWNNVATSINDDLIQDAVTRMYELSGNVQEESNEKYGIGYGFFWVAHNAMVSHLKTWRKGQRSSKKLFLRLTTRQLFDFIIKTWRRGWDLNPRHAKNVIEIITIFLRKNKLDNVWTTPGTTFWKTKAPFAPSTKRSPSPKSITPNSYPDDDLRDVPDYVLDILGKYEKTDVPDSRIMDHGSAGSSAEFICPEPRTPNLSNLPNNFNNLSKLLAKFVLSF